MKVVPGRTQIGPVLVAFVSEDQGHMCTQFEVETAIAGWPILQRIRICRGVTQCARQSAPENEGTDTV